MSVVSWWFVVGITLATYFTLCSASRFHETFEEELVIRPLKDGKVASKFSFTTLLQDASPRNPETLGFEDTGEYKTYFQFYNEYIA